MPAGKARWPCGRLRRRDFEHAVGQVLDAVAQILLQLLAGLRRKEKTCGDADGRSGDEGEEELREFDGCFFFTEHRCGSFLMHGQCAVDVSRDRTRVAARRLPRSRSRVSCPRSVPAQPLIILSTEVFSWTSIRNGSGSPSR